MMVTIGESIMDRWAVHSLAYGRFSIGCAGALTLFNTGLALG